MKKKGNGSAIRKFFVAAGICLLTAAAAILISWQYGIRTSQQQSDMYVHTIRTLIPNPQGAVLENRQNNDMPVLSLDGTDFIGILEIPRYDSALPICADWDYPYKYPCCLSGSIYDGTIQIGGTSQKGQYDFYRDFSVGDALFFTDMAGNRYAYTVTDIHHEKHADQAALTRENASLTLFIKNVYAFEYIVIFCDVLS